MLFLAIEVVNFTCVRGGTSMATAAHRHGHLQQMHFDRGFGGSAFDSGPHTDSLINAATLELIDFEMQASARCKKIKEVEKYRRRGGQNPPGRG